VWQRDGAAGTDGTFDGWPCPGWSSISFPIAEGPDEMPRGATTAAMIAAYVWELGGEIAVCAVLGYARPRSIRLRATTRGLRFPLCHPDKLQRCLGRWVWAAS